MATEFESFRFAAAATLALLSLTACSSKNPDTLIGMNLDENAAMMDANASVEANLGGADPSANDSAADRSSANAASTSTDASAPQPPTPPKPPRAPRSDQVNAGDSSTNTVTPLNQVEDDQADDQSEVPNASSNSFR
ncbi:MAG: hypothetical protein ACM3ZV_05825 [Bacillota bacterium]